MTLFGDEVQWFAMETAPKTGEQQILVTDGKIYAVAHWGEFWGDWHPTGAHECNKLTFVPKLWTPIPFGALPRLEQEQA